MPLIQPKPEDKKMPIKLNVSENLMEQIKQYCDFGGFKNHDEFFEEAAYHIVTRDKGFKGWVNSKEK